MLTVPEAARIAGRNPETVRRWIREGKLRARKVGTQHVIEEDDLRDLIDGDDRAPVPESWKTMWNGQPMPNWVAILRDVRRGR